VAAVRAEGGTLSAEDLAAYQPLWTAPFRASVKGWELVTAGAPNYGGAGLIEGINTAEAAGLLEGADVIRDPARFVDLAQIARAGEELSLFPESGDFP